MRPSSILSRFTRFTSLNLDTRVSHVRKVAKMSVKEWEIFRQVTVQATRAQYGDNLTMVPKKWFDVPEEMQEKIKASIREKLKQLRWKSMPPDEIVQWRMHKLFKYLKPTRRATEARDAYKAKVEAAGHGRDFESHKARFIRLVRTEIQQFATENPDLVWNEITPSTKNDIAKRVNEQLNREGIVEADDDFMFVQMELQLMSHRIRKNKIAEEMNEG